MYRLLLQIREQMNETNGVYQNAVRKYYLFVNGESFPLLSQYERTRRYEEIFIEQILILKYIEEIKKYFQQL